MDSKAGLYRWGCTRIFLVIAIAVMVFFLAVRFLDEPLDGGATVGDAAWEDVKLVLEPLSPAHQWAVALGVAGLCLMAGWGMGGIFKREE